MQKLSGAGDSCAKSRVAHVNLDRKNTVLWCKSKKFESLNVSRLGCERVETESSTPKIVLHLKEFIISIHDVTSLINYMFCADLYMFCG